MKTNFLISILFFIVFSAKAQYKIVTKTDTINAFDIAREGNFFFYYLSEKEYELNENQKKIHINNFIYIYSEKEKVLLSDEELNYFYVKDSSKFIPKIFPKSIGVNIFRFMQYSDINIFYEKRIANQIAIKFDLSKSKSFLRNVYGFQNVNRIQLETLCKYYFLKECRTNVFVEAGLGAGYYLIYVRETGFPTFPDFEQNYFYYNRFGTLLFTSTGISYFIKNNLKIEFALGLAYRSHFRTHSRYDFSRIPLQFNLAYNFQ